MYFLSFQQEINVCVVKKKLSKHLGATCLWVTSRLNCLMLLIPLVASQPAKQSYEKQRVSPAANGQTNQRVSLQCKLAAPQT